ncbi:MAG: prepilin-type N-terminal cleavage/methylation domain-containing protein [Myxococcales bacterium]|nr:prepilin-type N-terminal cleavage/methylation domain-containing protein [Polyangiaceae bacterium]MDW8247870.1 prepilin-type N-terminal cleavage/methylation domain-containing protein [Myxococcales bacterium]
MKHAFSLVIPRSAPRARGYTLTELMLVVTMVGILSALAMVGYRKYVESAKISEPISVIQAIRSAEEEFKDKTMTYLNVSGAEYYPRNIFDSKKMNFSNPGHPDYMKWQTLGVSVAGPVRFGYKVNTGNAGVAVAIPIEYKNPPNFGAPTNPWYIVQAKGDPNEDGKPTVLLATSFSSGVAYHEDQDLAFLVLRTPLLVRYNQSTGIPQPFNPSTKHTRSVFHACNQSSQGSWLYPGGADDRSGDHRRFGRAGNLWRAKVPGIGQERRGPQHDWFDQS